MTKGRVINGVHVRKDSPSATTTVQYRIRGALTNHTTVDPSLTSTEGELPFHQISVYCWSVQYCYESSPDKKALPNSVSQQFSNYSFYLGWGETNISLETSSTGPKVPVCTRSKLEINKILLAQSRVDACTLWTVRDTLLQKARYQKTSIITVILFLKSPSKSSSRGVSFIQRQSKTDCIQR